MASNNAAHYHRRDEVDPALFCCRVARRQPPALILSRATLMNRWLPSQMAKDAKAAVAILYHLKTDTIARVNHKAKGYEGRKMYKARAANIYYEPVASSSLGRLHRTPSSARSARKPAWT